MSNLKCEDCGKINETVKKTTCPYAEEIHNEIIERVVCDDCYHERLMDI